MIERHAIIEDVLLQHRNQLEDDYDKYRNHVYRVFNFTILIYDSRHGIDQEALAIASAYHDIGIWTAGTFDYLDPSIVLAKEYIKSTKSQVLPDVVEQIINYHHKVTPLKTNNVAEAFRRADLADLSLGMLSSGIRRRDISEIYRTFPAAGFHFFILKKILINIMRHPLNPLPILKW